MGLIVIPLKSLQLTDLVLQSFNLGTSYNENLQEHVYSQCKLRCMLHRAAICERPWIHSIAE